MSTKKNILTALRREGLSVADLCGRLGVTRNAINVQLRQLRAEGLVRAVCTRRTGPLGKPALIYEAAPHSEDSSSSAYRPLLASMVAIMASRLGQDALVDVLEQAGRHMARQAGLADPVNVEAGLRAAMNVADSLGATTEAVRQADGIMVRNYSCPVGAVARDEPCVCQGFAAFFSEATGRPVTQHCLRGDRLTCQYLISVA